MGQKMEKQILSKSQPLSQTREEITNPLHLQEEGEETSNDPRDLYFFNVSDHYWTGEMVRNPRKKCVRDKLKISEQSPQLAENFKPAKQLPPIPTKTTTSKIDQKQGEFMLSTDNGKNAKGNERYAGPSAEPAESPSIRAKQPKNITEEKKKEIKISTTQNLRMNHLNTSSQLFLSDGCVKTKEDGTRENWCGDNERDPRVFDHAVQISNGRWVVGDNNSNSD